MSGSSIVKLAVAFALWLALVSYIISNAQITFVTVFSIAASAIIIFVPMFKKYTKKQQ